MRLALIAPLGAAGSTHSSWTPQWIAERCVVESAQQPSGDDERPAEEPSLRQTAFALAGVGMTLAVAAVGGAALGWFADSRFDTTPIGILVGLVLGLASGIAAIWREVRTYLGN